MIVYAQILLIYFMTAVSTGDLRTNDNVSAPIFGALLCLPVISRMKLGGAGTHRILLAEHLRLKSDEAED